MEASVLGLNRIVFLDRDGVINENTNTVNPETGEQGPFYVLKWDDFKFRAGVLASLKKLNDANIQVIIVTMQKCVGYGLISPKDLKQIHSNMRDAIKEAGGDILDIRAAFEGKDKGFMKAQMIEDAMRQWQGDRERCYVVGDSTSDMIGGSKVGLRSFFVQTESGDTNWDGADYVVNSLAEAVNIMLQLVKEKACNSEK